MPEHNQPRNESNLALDVLESGAAYKVRVHDILKLGIEITMKLLDSIDREDLKNDKSKKHFDDLKKVIRDYDNQL